MNQQADGSVKMQFFWVAVLFYDVKKSNSPKAYFALLLYVCIIADVLAHARAAAPLRIIEGENGYNKNILWKLNFWTQTQGDNSEC